ncbi:MAG: hypothetical protein IPJ04_10660 [Candidatus Eisenbacteria bacterium]|nr:hypothetical protein [Candidatus Eisenbacteria bacterium]
MSMPKLVRSLVASVVSSAIPSLAHACAVCLNGANDNSRKAFFDMTMLMTILPLALFAAALGWLAWKARDILAHEFRESDEMPSVAAVEATEPTA